MIPEHLAVLSIVFFFLAALVIPLVSRLGAWLPHALAVATCAMVFAMNAAGLPEVLAAGRIRYALGGWAPPIGIELILDPLSVFFVLMISGIAAIVLLHSRRLVPVELEGRGAVFYSAALLTLGALTGMVLTGDLFNLYVFLEIAALSGYALLGSGTARAAVATFRYLILGTVGASFYLLGIGLIFLGTGTLNMVDLTAIVAVTGIQPLIVIGLVFIVAGMGLKMALFPLHLWLPDVYIGLKPGHGVDRTLGNESRGLRDHPAATLRDGAGLGPLRSSFHPRDRCAGGDRDRLGLDHGHRAGRPPPHARVQQRLADRLYCAGHRAGQRPRLHRGDPSRPQSRVHEGVPVSRVR